MAEKIKVQRKRKRLYDPIPEETGQDERLLPSPPMSMDATLPQPDTTGSTEPLETPQPPEGKLDQARAIVQKYSLISAASAVIPIPIVDLLAVSTVQVQMLRELCRLYGNDFSEERIKVLVTSLIGGFHAGLFAQSFLKLVPVLGVALSAVSYATLSGGVTYAIGVVFIKHFETGGTLFDFNPSTYKKEFEKTLRGREETDRINTGTLS